jgi:cytohesin
MDEDRETPLYLAAEYGDAEIAQMLLDAGANPNKRNEDGESPLTIAQIKGQQRVIDVLEKRQPAARP